MALTTIDDRGLKTPIDLLDNEKIRFGTGNDLELYHDGSNSYIKDAGTGQLRILSNQVLIQNAAGDANQIICTESGSVDLHYNGSKKLETRSDGVGITGILNMTSHIYLGDNDHLLCGAGNDLQIYHNGTDSYINDTGTGRLMLLSNQFQVNSADNSEIQIRASENGAVELYYNGVKTFLTDSNGITVQGPEGGNGVINLYADEGDDNADKWRLQSNTNTYFYLANYGDGSWETNILAKPGAEVQLYYDNSKKLETTSLGATIDRDLTLNHASGDTALRWAVGGTNKFSLYESSGTLRLYDNTNSAERLHIASNGDLGVGISSPPCRLAVKDTAEFTAYANATPSSTQCLMQLYNNPPNETANDHASIQFGVNGGSHNRVASISAVAESAGNRKLALAFCTDDAGSRTEKVRIQGDGGISFNGDTAAANALDDYEVGNHTVADASGDGIGLTNETTSIYTKIGRFVNFQFDISVASNSDTGTARVTIPFQADTTSYGGGACGWTDLGRPAFGHVSSSGCWLMDNDSSGSGKHLSWQQCSGKRFIMQIQYITT